MVKKFGLGRGLGSLIPPQDQYSQNESGHKTVFEPEETAVPITVSPQDSDTGYSVSGNVHQVEYLNPQSIVTSDLQPRQVFEHTALEELVNSIKENGILEPLIVSPVGDGRYKLVAGERRLRAAKIIGMQAVPSIVRTVSEQQRLEFSLIENVQRRDLNPLEEAFAYQKLIDEFNLTQEEISKKVGKSRSKIANALRLLKLPHEIRQLISSGRLTEGHAKVILELDDPVKQKQFVKQVLKQGLSVRETEGIVSQVRKHPTEHQVINQKLIQLGNELGQRLKTKVTIKPRRKGGIIQIEYYADEELHDLIERIG